MAIIPSGTQFVGVASSVNMAEKKSSQVNDTTTIYTLQDFEDSLTPDLTPITVDGNKVSIASNPLATTQSVAVIQSSTTNAGLVLQPNGTGAIMAQVPDGTAAGGDARGDYSVDFQITRSAADQVASGTRSFIGAGNWNKATGSSSAIVGGSSNTTTRLQSFIGSGNSNTISGGTENAIVSGALNTMTGAYGFIGAGLQNNISSNYSTVSGGQSNTASTNTHATVVGERSNTSSGQYSVSGGWTNVASGAYSVAFGRNCDSSAAYSIALGGYSRANGENSVCIGGSFGTGSLASGKYSVALGSYTRSYLHGQLSYTGNSFDKSYSTGAIYGQSQISFLNPSKIDTLASSATTVLSLDGTGTTGLIIPLGNNRAWNVTVKWVAVCTATGSGTTAVGDVAIATDSFMFKRVGGTSSIGTLSNLQNSQDATMAGATCSYAVGGSQDLQISFTAPASANATTFRVVAKVELTEVAW